MLQRNIFVVVALVATGSVTIANAQTDAEWNPAINGGDGSTYSDAANWDINAVPINNGTTYNVDIPGSNSVIFDAFVSGDTVSTFMLGTGSTFTVNPGLTYNVLGATMINGRINVNNSTFSAPSATATFGGVPYLFADNSGSIVSGAASWSATYSGSQTVIRSDNATIALATLGSLALNDSYAYDTRTYTVHARNGGAINLSGLASASSNDLLRFLVESTGSIDLTSLTTTSNVQFDIEVATQLLPALNTANNTQFIARSGNTITANAMTDQNGGSVTLETNAVFNATAMQQMRNTTVSAQNGSTFNAPALTDVQGSTFNLDPGFTFTTGLLNNVDSARFFVSGGLNYAGVSATAMTSSFNASQTVLRASGNGSQLNLSSLTELTVNDQYIYDTRTYTVHGTDNGVVNLSGLTSASSNDLLQFLIDSDGDIVLTNLNTTSNVRFDVDRSATPYNLPALTQANGAQFDVGSNTTVSANAMTDHVGGTTNLQTEATLNATSLQSMRNVTFTAATNAEFNAPALTDVQGSTFHLDPGFKFTTGSLASVDGARFFISGGLNFASINDTSMTNSHNGSQTVLQADGNGSVLDLSSLSQLTINDQYIYDVRTYTVLASAGGKVDLSNVDTVSTNDKILFHVQSQSTVDLSSLQAVGAGQYEFRVEAEGTLLLGDFTVTNNTTFNINDVTSNVVIGGSLLLDSPAAFNVATGGGVSVAGNFSFAITDETAFQSDDGILTMNGTGTFGNPQFLEVGGQDLGLPGTDFGAAADAFDPFVAIGDNGNFNLGKLVVGVDGQPATVVELIDAIDNGNRLSPEALYLPGLGGDGLEIFGGSSLNIESINVYAFLDGEWVHLNSLFSGSITQIALSSVVSDPEANGFIVIPEPTTIALFGLTGLLVFRWRQ
jgi:hypothetical protein